MVLPQGGPDIRLLLESVVTVTQITNTLGEHVRKLQRFCASLSLAVALCIPGLANNGNIQTGLTQQPPPRILQPTEEDSSSTREVPRVNDAALVDPLTELAFALLNGVRLIF
jgi:hypothetical protein